MDVEILSNVVERLTLAQATVERFLERAHRLYEQEQGKPEGFPRLGAYVRRWRG